MHYSGIFAEHIWKKKNAENNCIHVWTMLAVISSNKRLKKLLFFFQQSIRDSVEDFCKFFYTFFSERTNNWRVIFPEVNIFLIINVCTSAEVETFRESYDIWIDSILYFAIQDVLRNKWFYYCWPKFNNYLCTWDVVYGCLEIHLDFIKVVCFYLMYLYNGLQSEIILGWGCKRDR